MKNIIEKQKGETNREYAYRVLSEKIMQLEIEPSALIPEQDIATQLNISRTPVREAVIRLAQEEMVKPIPQKGTYVSLIDMTIIEESKFLRETMEIEIVKQVAQSNLDDSILFRLEEILNQQDFYIKKNDYLNFFMLDEKFHGLLFTAVNKVRIWNSIQMISSQFKRFRVLKLQTGSNEDLKALFDEHKIIVKAIKEKDLQLSKETIQHHLDRVKIDKEKLIGIYPQYFK